MMPVEWIGAPAEQDLKSNTLRLLFIEDSDTDAFLFLEAARELSIDVDVLRFVTANEAIAGLESGIPEVFHGGLLDLNLPGGNGLDVLRVMRNSGPTRRLPVVVMTSSISARDREAAESLGVEGYLSKPNDYAQYVAAVGRALRLITDADRSPGGG